MQSPPVPRYLVPPRSKYSPQHLILDVLRYNINEDCITSHLLLLLLSISFASRHAGKQRPVQTCCVRHCAVSHQHQTRANYYYYYLFIIPEAHQSGYGTCHYIIIDSVQES